MSADSLACAFLLSLWGLAKCLLPRSFLYHVVDLHRARLCGHGVLQGLHGGLAGEGCGMVSVRWGTTTALVGELLAARDCASVSCQEIHSPRAAKSRCDPPGPCGFGYPRACNGGAQFTCTTRAATQVPNPTDVSVSCGDFSAV